MKNGRIVTDVHELSSQRVQIYIDHEFAFVLYRGELAIYGIRVGEVLNEQEYIQIYTQLLPKRAKKRCMNLLVKRAYTEKALRDKLKEGHYPSDVIDEAISYVKSFGYIDDYDYACRYIMYHKEAESRRRIEEKLQQKGIQNEVIKKAFYASYDEGEEERLEIEQAYKYLRKKGYSPENTDWREKQKMYAFLGRKGLPFGIIKEVLGEREEEV